MEFINKLQFFFKNKLVNKSIKVLLLRVLGVLLFFSLTLLLTNYFDANLVGQYDFSRALLMFLGGICLFGTHQSIIYYSGYLVSKNALGNLKGIYKKMTIIVFSTSVIICIFTFVVNDSFINKFFEKDVSGLVTKTVATLFFYAITMLNIDVFRAINKMLTSELYRNIYRYTPFLLLILLIYVTNNLSLLVDVYLLNFVFLAFISSLYLFIFFSKNNNTNPDYIITYKAILSRSGPMAISSIAYILMQSVDVIILSKFTDFKTVAFYSVAIKLTTMISLVL